MTKEQSSVKEWMQKAKQETPGALKIPDIETRRLRARLIFEEALETIHALGVEITVHPGITYLDLKDVEFERSIQDCDLVEVADGLADLQVVGLGTAVACGIDLEPCFNEVMSSNNSKWWRSADLDSPAFKDGFKFERLSGGLHCVTDAGGKIQKGPNYRKPDIWPIIGKMVAAGSSAPLNPKTA